MTPDIGTAQPGKCRVWDLSSFLNLWDREVTCLLSTHSLVMIGDIMPRKPFPGPEFLRFCFTKLRYRHDQ